jgi:PRC-barrel domain
MVKSYSCRPGGTRSLGLGTVTLVVCLVSAAASMAQAPGKIEAEAVEWPLGLIGASVFADGREVGKLADLSFTEDGRIDRIRVSTGAVLGFGARTVEIPKGGYTLLRDAVLLDFPASALDTFPTVTVETALPEDDRK